MIWARWKISSGGWPLAALAAPGSESETPTPGAPEALIRAPVVLIRWMVAGCWLSACAHHAPVAVPTYAPTHVRTYAQEVVPHPRVHFPTNRTTLVRRDRPKLAADASWLRQTPTVAVILEGHADARGPTDRNLALGDRRARAVAGLLMARGVDPRQIVGVLSRGEDRPIRRGHTPRAWAANRRVEVLVR